MPPNSEFSQRGANYCCNHFPLVSLADSQEQAISSNVGPVRRPTASFNLKENRGETSHYPSVASRRFRCLGNNGSKRGGVRSRRIPGRLCRGTGRCRRPSSCLQTWCCRRASPPQGLLKTARWWPDFEVKPIPLRGCRLSPEALSLHVASARGDMQLASIELLQAARNHPNFKTVLRYCDYG
jgi:hypothetical protein